VTVFCRPCKDSRIYDHLRWGVRSCRFFRAGWGFDRLWVGDD